MSSGSQCFFVLRFYLFLDRGKGREEKRERNINAWLPLLHPLLGTWPATQVCTLTGNRTGELWLSMFLLRTSIHFYSWFFVNSPSPWKLLVFLNNFRMLGNSVVEFHSAVLCVWFLSIKLDIQGRTQVLQC